MIRHSETHLLQDINLRGNKLLCNCELASFSELLQNKSLHRNSVECANGSTLDKVDFGKMNCIDNTDVCTKPKEDTDAIPSTSNKKFTVTIINITQIEDTLGIKYFINKSSNFSESDYSCKIRSKHVNNDYFEEADLCVFSMQKEEHVNVAVSGGEGNYSVCIDILYKEVTYLSECQFAHFYEPVETTTEGQSTSDASKTIPSTTVSFSAGESTMLVTATATTTSVTTVSLSTGKNTIPNTTAATITSVTTVSTGKSTMPFISTAKTTSVATSVHETSTTSLPEIYTTGTLKETTELSDEKALLSTLHPSSPSEAPTISALTNTITKFQTYFESVTTSAGVVTTTHFPSYFETATPSMGPMKPSFNAPSVKSFFLQRNAKGQLILSWNVTLGPPQVVCYLNFSVLFYNKPEKNWTNKCTNGSILLGDIENTNSYRICVAMYLQEKFVEKNCTEFSPILPDPAVKSKSTWISSKLPMAAFIALVILAVIILILIIIVLIKLVYLKRNKANVYYVAKEEVSNHGEITKRNSNLYSVNPVEDDQV